MSSRFFKQIIQYSDITPGTLTAEYNGGTRTLQQFLRAVAYLVPEGENY
ncbi:hypothetical protein T09_5998 [Trichinella sp. T9]|nr:hypothetical protein T09_5998 [Trichinella sp. T9]